ncbi:transcription regulator [Herbaspirillum sp. GW103]|jgi:DNA-binding transcriptional regulator LsrR (DeoR family)|uniref:sugar-binding transcriptional regulator n=1 Tax=unclassified Herbaspirillum TaxID=2624150 RepID=UPI00025E4EF4|nr:MULTISPECIES: sugar-binding transcriptional regulator [unclassified Herbaspirillum]EIJ45159.1 transcription regulator [Herbaspirillum sp. GW103]MCI1004504.1 sugar-binding transcriptional regulator [Herbaspirillum sp. C7C8]NUT60324.1 sugar-binding transcriptional regulator [Herbaspirillum sp. C9C3]
MSSSASKLDLAARAAWMYYVAGNTQNEIAERLGISRQMAQRMVAYAADANLVRVQITHPVSSCLELAQGLQERYGLEVCRVVPGAGGADNPNESQEVQQMLAVAGAEVMEQYLSSQAPLVVNVGSGRTLKAAIERLSELERPQHQIVSMIGAFASDGSANRYDVALQAAEKLGARFYLLPAPRVAESERDRQQWCNHRAYKIVTGLAERADVTFLGIGTIALQGAMHEDGFIDDEEVADLQRQGAVGEMICHAFDRDGAMLSSSLAARVTTPPLAQAPQRPVIALSGGSKKADAVRAALRGGWLTGLVTDETCARHALQD